MLKRLSIVCMVIAVLICGVSWFSVFNSPAVEKVELSEVEKTIKINSSFELKVNQTPIKAKIFDSELTWKTSNPQIATVNNYGKVQALNVGECEISVTYKTTKLTCKVEVEPIFVEGVSMEFDYYAIHPAETMQLTTTVYPNNATYKDVTYSSSNTQVATISQTGLITGVAEGKTTITVYGSNNKQNSFELEVKNVIEIEKINLSIVEDTNDVEFTLYSKQITATILPANADNKTLTWTSSNPDVISVDADGKFLTKTHGQATITATAVNGKTKTITLYVPKVEANYCNIENKLGDSVSKLTLSVNETHALKIEIKAMKTVSGTSWITFVQASTREVEWTSNNPAKVSVDENGILTAHETTKSQFGLDVGVVITAKIKGVSGNVYDTITVYVD